MNFDLGVSSSELTSLESTISNFLRDFGRLSITFDEGLE